MYSLLLTNSFSSKATKNITPIFCGRFPFCLQSHNQHLYLLHCRIEFLATKDWAWVDEESVWPCSEATHKLYAHAQGKIKRNSERLRLFKNAVMESLSLHRKKLSVSGAGKIVKRKSRSRLIKVLNPVYQN